MNLATDIREYLDRSSFKYTVHAYTEAGREVCLGEEGFFTCHAPAKRFKTLELAKKKLKDKQKEYDYLFREHKVKFIQNYFIKEQGEPVNEPV